jgi:pilus assembly protein CpaC
MGWHFLTLTMLVVSAPLGAWSKDSHKETYVSLTVGLTHDEKLPSLPARISTAGDFRKVTGVSFDRNTNTFRFTPKRVGIGTLTVLDARGQRIHTFRLDVKRSNLNKAVLEIRSLLGDIDGIQVKIVNNKVIVDGQLLLPKDISRIYSVVRQFGDVASSIVTLSPLAQRKIAQLIGRDINNPDVRVRAVNNKFVLEGQVASPDEKTRAEVIAKTYIPDIFVDEATKDGLIQSRKVDAIINLITLKAPPPEEPGKIIQMVVHYVELQKDYEKGFRFQWTPDLGDGSKVSFQTGDRGPSGIITTITGTISNLLPKLNWAKQHGHARVLQSSSLIVQDGQKGEIKSTVRIPYAVTSANGQPSTNFEEVGIVSIVTPKILSSRSDSIELTMDFSIRNLISISDAGPLTSGSRINTVIVVRSNQSAAVGGLISNSSGTNYNKLPQNSSPNPLFSLYASKDFRRSQSQFVVFVTPIIKRSASAGSEKVMQKFRLAD